MTDILRDFSFGLQDLPEISHEMLDIESKISIKTCQTTKYFYKNIASVKLQFRPLICAILTMTFLSTLVCLPTNNPIPTFITMPQADPRAKLPGPQVSLGGVVEWTRKWDFPAILDKSEAVATNGTQYVYLAGTFSQNEAFLAKCDASGTSLWNRTWGGSGSDKAHGVATDWNGSIYIAGETNSFGAGGSDAFLAKYDSSGMSLWNRTWGHGHNEVAYGIATDGSGNVYIAIYDIGSDDASLAKYDPSGTQQWNRTWGGIWSDIGYAVATDGSGNVYLAGCTQSYGAGSDDAFLAKYDPSGLLLWNYTWGGAYPDLGKSIAADGFGNVYLAGATQSFGAGIFDAFLAKYDSSGTSLWNRTWGGSDGDGGRGLAADWSGNTFLVGYTNSYGAGQEDAFLAEFDPNGTSLWNRTWRGIYDETGRAVATDGNGNIYFACDDYNDPYLVKFNQIAPPIIINTPSEGMGFHFAPQFNVITVPEMNASWYAVGATGTNRTFTPGVLTQVNTVDWGAQPEGPITLRFWANDTEGDLGYAQVTVKKDSIDPLIIINFPAPGQLFSETAPTFSLAVTESNLNATWYTLDGGATDTICGLTGDLAEQWSSMPNGTVTVTFWANDTAGNENSTSITIQKDTSLPSIAGTGLAEGQLCNVTPPTFNLTIIGGGLATWYSLDGGANNITCAYNQTVQVDAARWAAQENGTVAITFWVNGTAGYVTSTSITLNKDVLAPLFTSKGLSAWQVFGAAAPVFSLGIIEGNLNATWYSLDGGATNTTCGLTGSLSAQWAARPNGTVTVTFWANDLVGNSTTTSLTIWKDIIDPTLEISIPSVGASFLDAPSFAMTYFDINLEAVWYTLSNDPTKYFITDPNGKIDAGAWAAQPAGQVTINFYANDTGSNIFSRDVVIVKLTWFEANYLYVIAVVAIVSVISLVTWQRIKSKRAKDKAQFQAFTEGMDEGKLKLLGQVKDPAAVAPANMLPLGGITSKGFVAERPVMALARVGSEESVAVAGVEVFRGGQIEGLHYIYKVKVKNNSDNTITDVSIHVLNYPRDNMTLEGEELRHVAKIEPQGFRSLEFKLTPRSDCVEGKLVSAVNFMDSKNEFHTLSVEPLEIRSVCDLMSPLEIDEADFDKLVGSWASTRAVFNFEGEDPHALLADVPTILRSKNFFTVNQRQFPTETMFNAEVKGIAVGKYTRKKLAIDVIMEVNTTLGEGTVTCTGLAEDPSMLVACLQEVMGAFRQRLERFWDTRVAKLRDVMNIQHMLVIHKDTGTAIMSQNYAGEKIDGNLISGFLTAMTSFQSEIAVKKKESTGKKGFLLDYADFKILLEDGEFIRPALILETDPTDTLKERLASFTQRYESFFREKLQKWRGFLDDVIGGDIIFEEMFEMSLLYPHIVNPTANPGNLGKIARAVYAMGQAISKDKPYFFLATLMDYAIKGLQESQQRIFSTIYDLKKNHAIEPTIQSGK